MLETRWKHNVRCIFFPAVVFVDIFDNVLHSFNKKTESTRTFPRVHCDAAFIPRCQPRFMLDTNASEGNCKVL